VTSKAGNAGLGIKKRTEKINPRHMPITVTLISRIMCSPTAIFTIFFSLRPWNT